LFWVCGIKKRMGKKTDRTKKKGTRDGEHKETVQDRDVRCWDEGGKKCRLSRVKRQTVKKILLLRHGRVGKETRMGKERGAVKEKKLRGEQENEELERSSLLEKGRTIPIHRQCSYEGKKSTKRKKGRGTEIRSGRS